MGFAHYHGGYELYYLIRGEREYFIEDKFYKVKEGDIVFIPSPIIHRTSGRTADRTLIYFSEDFLKRFFKSETLSSLSLSEPFVFRAPEKQAHAFAEDFENILRVYSEEDEKDNSAFFAGMVFKILFSISGTKNCYEMQDFHDMTVENIVSYINENYSTISGLDEIADRFFISKFHLCRLFSKNLGMSIMTYLNMVRIREACALIKNTQINLTEIATRCGFNSESYFCKLFKSEMGVSPSAYRKK